MSTATKTKMLNLFEGYALSPFEYSRLYGSEKYNLQHMVLKMVNCPSQIDPAVDKHYSVYSDRAGQAWWTAWKLLVSTGSADAYGAMATDESFLLFVGKLFALVQNSDQFHKRAEEFKKQYNESAPCEVDGVKDYSLAVEYEERGWAAAAAEIDPLPITGAVLIRETNQASGYPCPCIVAVKLADDTSQRLYSGNNAPFIKHPEHRNPITGRRMRPDLGWMGDL